MDLRRIYPIEDMTLGKVVADKARRNGDRLFIHYLPDERRYSFRETHSLSNRVANGLLAAGAGKGTHVATFMENSPEQLFAFFALGKIGAVNIPINIAARGHSLQYFLTQSDSTMLIVDAELLPYALEVWPNTKIDRIFVQGQGDAVAKQWPKGVDSFDTLLAAPDDDLVSDVRFNDLYSIFYTSGTTGPSKGCMFTHYHSLTFSRGIIDEMRLDADDIYHVCLPVFHTAAWTGQVLPMLLLDGSLGLTRRFSASRLWEEVRQSGASALNLLSVSSFLLAQPPSPEDRNTRFRVGITAPVPVNAREFEARFGGRLISGYGLSDFGAPLCQTLDMPEDKRQSCGQPLADFQVRLVDDDDFEVPVGVPGEITLRVDNPWEMSSGYYNQPEATLRAMRNLWFHTGDRAYRDADGYYYFVDRKKDAIRRRGENISTYEVEAAIGTHAAVADVAVYPVRANTGEDDVAASIVLKHDATLVEIEVIRHCERNLPYFAIPRFVHFADELPRTLTQKVKKFELRAYVEENIDRIWDHELIEGKRRRR